MFVKLISLIISFSMFTPISTFSGTSAESAILMEQSSGKVLFAQNPHERLKIASITKIMTAILAIEEEKMDKVVEISQRATLTEGSSLYLKVGQKVKMEDLIYGLMLRSGNDAAVAIAEEIGGSVDGFVFMMNQKATEIGMKNTAFQNPHGLDEKGHYSSAYDMALLTKYAMQNHLYREIVGTKLHKGWQNKNRLLTQLYPYCTGGKTGFTKRAGRTLVSTATKGKMDLIAVTINDGDDWNTHMNLFHFGFNQYEMAEVLKKGQVREKLSKTYDGRVYIQNEFYYPLTRKEQNLINIRYKIFTDRKLVGKIGVAEVYLSGKKIGERGIFYGKKKSKSVFSQLLGEISW